MSSFLFDEKLSCSLTPFKISAIVFQLFHPVSLIVSPWISFSLLSWSRYSIVLFVLFWVIDTCLIFLPKLCIGDFLKKLDKSLYNNIVMSNKSTSVIGKDSSSGTSHSYSLKRWWKACPSSESKIAPDFVLISSFNVLFISKYAGDL